MKENQKMKMTDEDELNLKNATCCHICKWGLKAKEIKVRDHCHRTGKFRGAAHDICNSNYCSNRVLPLFLHNVKDTILISMLNKLLK